MLKLKKKLEKERKKLNKMTSNAIDNDSINLIDTTIIKQSQKVDKLLNYYKKLQGIKNFYITVSLFVFINYFALV